MRTGLLRVVGHGICYLNVLPRGREALVDLTNLTHAQSGRVDRLENEKGTRTFNLEFGVMNVNVHPFENLLSEHLPFSVSR